MATLSHAQIAEILMPYAAVSDDVLAHLSDYLDLLLKWNARTNLTAIRDPKEIVRRHFGESVFVARHLPACDTLLDFGSGAGFPGIPIQCVRPEVQVTLAESQNKKASFLREAVRVLGLNAEIWAARVEAMPSHRRFDVVTLRAVDNPALAIREARKRLVFGGTLASLTSRMADSAPSAGVTFFPLPGSSKTVLELRQSMS